MSGFPYETRSSWSWPENIAAASAVAEEDTPLPRAFAHEEPEEVKEEEAPASPFQANESTAPKPTRHYAPRTCRICFEIVHPSFEPMEGAPSIFNPAPRVQYISEDPKSGRLIRPCHCKGSGRYVHEGCLQEWRHADKRYGRRKCVSQASSGNVRMSYEDPC